MWSSLVGMLEEAVKGQDRCKSDNRGECSGCSPLSYTIQIKHKSVYHMHDKHNDKVVEIIW